MYIDDHLINLCIPVDIGKCFVSLKLNFTDNVEIVVMPHGLNRNIKFQFIPDFAVRAIIIMS